jgi:hypothetical protein
MWYVIAMPRMADYNAKIRLMTGAATGLLSLHYKR